MAKLVFTTSGPLRARGTRRSAQGSSISGHNRGSVLGTGVRPLPTPSLHITTALVLRVGRGLDVGNAPPCLQGLALTHSFHSLTNPAALGGRVSFLFQSGNQRRSEVKGQSQELGVTPEHGAFLGKVLSLPTTANDFVPKTTQILYSFLDSSQGSRSQDGRSRPSSGATGVNWQVRHLEGWPQPPAWAADSSFHSPLPPASGSLPARSLAEMDLLFQQALQKPTDPIRQESNAPFIGKQED